MDRDMAALKDQILQEIRKAEPGLASTSFTVTGSALQPKQLEHYLQIIQDNTAAMGAVRTERMDRLQLDIPKMFFGPPMTRGVAEAVDVVAAGNTYRRAPLFSAIRLDVTGNKLVTYCPITNDAAQAAVERPNFQQKVAEGLFKKNADDLENLFWNGDTVTYAGDTTDEGTLRAVLDGIGVLSQSSRVVDAEGSTMQQEVFLAAIRNLPSHYQNVPDLAFWMNPFIALDWQTSYAQRQTGGGDAATGQANWGVAPYGVPIFKGPKALRAGVPHIPVNLSLPVAVATAAEIYGTSIGPYKITAGSNDAYSVNIDAAGAVAGTFPAGVWDPSTLAEIINADLVATYGSVTYAYCCRVDQKNHLYFVSPTTGAASSVAIVNPANSVWATLGFTAGVTNGSAAGAGAVLEGSYMLLTPAKNMLFGIYTGPAGGQGQYGVRVFQRYEPQNDTHEFFMYVQPDVQVENLDCMVRVENIRVSSLTP